MLEFYDPEQDVEIQANNEAWWRRSNFALSAEKRKEQLEGLDNFPEGVPVSRHVCALFYLCLYLSLLTLPTSCTALQLHWTNQWSKQE